MSDNHRRLLDKAEEAIEEGDRSSAQLILANLIKLNPRSEEAWWLLAKVVDDKDKTIYCLKQVVKLNPDNDSARRSLQVLERPTPEERLAAESARVSPFTRETVQPEHVQQFSRGTAVRQPSHGEAPAIPTSPRAELRRTGVLELQEEADLEAVKPRRRWNWPLYLGLFILVVLAFLTIAGPGLAPRDPLEENLIIRVGEGWDIPPFPFLTPGFPLGSDQYGRDIFSRLLHGIRPTMIMVLIVAVVRLMLGMLNGLISGWSSGWLARALNNLIEGALSIPVLLVALGAIAIVGVEWGIWAFIIGFSLTGWVETAQQVREQTRIIKGQAYVEASQALGASNRQVLIGHILRQILPMSLMLFAFEMSSTLMTTAGLGFLGYYIGGDVWIEVSDFVARRISGQPELGQMLATSWATLTQPWGMVAVGSTIFLAVLGFNLTGEGLRHNLDLTIVKRRGVLAQAREKAGFWLDQNVWYPLSGFLGKPAVRTALNSALVLAVLAGVAALAWPRVQTWIASRPDPEEQASLGGGNPEAGAPASENETEAPQVTSTPEISYDPQVVWEFNAPSGFLGGPAHSPDGEVIYAASQDGVLQALDLDGEALWQVELPTGALGTPVVDDAGNLYVTDPDAGLSKVSPEGEQLWHFQSTAAPSTSAGPVLNPDGVIYYTVTTGSRGFVQAVTMEGEGLWASEGVTTAIYEQAAVSANREYVFLKSVLINAQTGATLEPETELNVLRYFSGEDGFDYLVSGNNVIRWELNGGRIEVVDIAEWDTSEMSQSTAPSQVGVLANSTAWMLYTSPGGSTRIVWVTLDDNFLGSAVFDVSSGQLLAMQPYLDGFQCGGRSFQPEYVKCAVVYPDGHTPRWEIDLGSPGEVQGGFWLGKRLYLTTVGGDLYAIDPNLRQEQAGDSQTEAPSNAAAPAESGVAWRYQYPEPVDRLSLRVRQGRVYVLSQSHETLFIVSPSGELEQTLELASAPFRLEDSRSFSPIVMPSIFDDGAIVIVDENLRVYALSSTGEHLWEYALEASLEDQPILDSLGRLIVTDRNAGVSAFDETGFLWRFQSQAAEYTAAPPLIAPDGTIYYVPTSFSSAYLQAVSPEGAGLWATRVETIDFYNTPILSPDGRFVFLQEDVFEAETGRLIPAEFPEPVNDIILGADGNAYFRSRNALMGFEVVGEGIEVISTTTWLTAASDAFQPPQVFVDENSVIWLYQGDNLIWISLDGEVLGTRPLDFTLTSDFIYPASGNTRRLLCESIPQDNALDCSLWEVGLDEPVWDETLENIPNFPFASLNADKYAHLISFEDELVKLYIDYPE